MLRFFFKGLARYARMVVVAFVGCFDSERRLAGALLALLILPLIFFAQLFHWILWLVDEIAFPDYRSVRIKQPVFIIGPPRTGTTFLHHVLAKDENYSTFRLWECLFGITICGRKICIALARFDRFLGAPTARLGGWLTAKFLTELDDIHPVSLNSPEEDFFVFMPVALCFLLIVPYPGADWLFRFSRFDVSYSDKEKRLFMRWYRRCIQKQLYVNGREKQFLSKNASFSGMSSALLDEFTDARILATRRDPLEAVPSQLSSLLPSLRWFGIHRIPEDLRDRLVSQMAFYYAHLEKIEQENPSRVARIENEALRENLAETVRSAYARLDLGMGTKLAEYLDEQAVVSKNHRSTHKYAAEDFGLSEELIKSRFDFHAD